MVRLWERPALGTQSDAGTGNQLLQETEQPQEQGIEMYKEMTAGGVCVIAADTPSYMGDLRAEYPGELVIDRVIMHRGETEPSYRIKNVPMQDDGRPVWINGRFLDFVRYEWEPAPAQGPTQSSGQDASAEGKPETLH